MSDGKRISRRESIKDTAISTAAVAAFGVLGTTPAAAAGVPEKWDMTADVVIVGAGAVGLTASCQAIDDGASVILIDQNTEVGGHAIVSGGNIPLGGGTSLQKKFGINDSPDLIYADLTDPKLPDYRYNDRDLMRAFADNSAPTFEWLLAHGVQFPDVAPATNAAGQALGSSANRFQKVVSDGAVGAGLSPSGAAGAGFVRPMDAYARKKGVQILVKYKMTSIVRETPSSGRVLGITAKNLADNTNVAIRAAKGVVIGTGGNSSNVNFRRIFDPRLTEEYQVVGEPWSYQTADGEIAAMAIWASLWGTVNETLEFGAPIGWPNVIGCQYGTAKGGGGAWPKNSPILNLIRATGLVVADLQDLIRVNQVGLRFWDETQGGYADPPTTHSALNAALGPNGGTGNGGGPIWAIFDADAVKREKWNVTLPDVDPNGYFFSGSTIAELAANIKNPYQKKSMPADALQATVTKYNSFVDAGKDADFNKPTPKYKIQTPPFYAAWSTPAVHDTRSGLRINAKAQVMDLNGQVIPGLYCVGESAGGFSQHGLARCTVFARLAGKNATGEKAAA